eukprot:979038-Pyramimonas_sp.AAC.4
MRKAVSLTFVHSYTRAGQRAHRGEGREAQVHAQVPPPRLAGAVASEDATQMDGRDRTSLRSGIYSGRLLKFADELDESWIGIGFVSRGFALCAAFVCERW